VADDIVGPTGSIRDATIQGLDGKSARRIPCDHGVEAPAETIDLDDVPGLDPFEAHV